MAALDDIISQASQKYGVPEDQIRALIQQESGGQQFAKSGKGAQGLMQIMPDTYAELRTKHGLGYNAYEPYNNVMGGTAYFRQMLDQFKDPKGALAAYNMGPHAYSEYQAGRRQMPVETQMYVASLGPKFGVQNASAAPAAPRQANGPPIPLTPPAAAVPPAQGLLQTAAPAPRGGLLADLLSDDSDPVPNRAEYLTTGALKGLAPLMGAQPTRVSFGQVLAGLGGGMQAGKAGYESALTGRRDNVLKRALMGSEIAKNLRDGKVSGTDDMQEYNFAVSSGSFTGTFPEWLKQVKGDKDGDGRTTDMKEYEYAKAAGQFNGTFPEWQKAKKEEDKGPGPFYGNGAEVQAANQLVKSGVPIDKVANWLLTKVAVGPNGAVDLYNPGNVPGYGAPPGTVAPPAPAAAPPTTPVDPTMVPQVGTTPPPAAVPPAAAPPAPLTSRVRQPDMSKEDKALIDESKTMVSASVTAADTLRTAKALSAKAYEGPLAEWKKMGSRVTGIGADAGQATQELGSIMTEQALSSLKATFGGQPTEGERKILLEMQASTTMSHPERLALLERAEKAVADRIVREQAKIQALQNGTYYSTQPVVPTNPDAPASPEKGRVANKYGLTKGQ